MRENKFRVYIRQLEMIRPVERINFDIETVEVHLSDSGDYHNDLYEYEFDEIELMQYTGLKDKNGKEIYEGDICIKYDLTNLRECGKGVVEYDELECLYAIGKPPIQYYVYNTATETPKACLKVIGNIYENPEFLQGE